MKPMSRSKHNPVQPMVMIAVILFLLGGCASYQPKPLPEGPDLVPDVKQLSNPVSEVSANQSSGLSLTEIAVLAVQNNPELKAQRTKLGIKRAQVFSAGLLPDPQLSASFDHPTGNLPDTVNAFSLGLNYDLIPLINRDARLESARQAEHQINLELLWQEWQVSQLARTLAVDFVSEGQQIDLLYGMRDLYQKRYHQSQKAVAQGDLTMGVAGADLTVLLDTISQINQLEQASNDTWHKLHLLLGLTADAPVAINLEPLPELPAAKILHRELATVSQRRPDLLALQAGYRSQEANVRAAILAQFPSFNIGINRARDTGSLYTTGFSIGLNLPLFSMNRGAIAIERATREQLHQEYQARLDQVVIDVNRLLRLQEIIGDQQKQLSKYLPILKEMVDRGRVAYQRGDIESLTFLNMENTWVSKRLEQINLEQTQRNTLIALQTLLAMPEVQEVGMSKPKGAVKGEKQ